MYRNPIFKNEFEWYNKVNLLRKSDFDMFPVSNSKSELITNIRSILTHLNNNRHSNTVTIKLFDYIVLYKSYLFNDNKSKPTMRLKKVIQSKLLEFSKLKIFGPMRSKYYIRLLFPDDKCIHVSIYTGGLCVYKKYKHFEYCRTHCEFAKSYSLIIQNNTRLYKNIVSLVVQYM
jgi:hypothetical protein